MACNVFYFLITLEWIYFYIFSFTVNHSRVRYLYDAFVFPETQDKFTLIYSFINIYLVEVTF